MKGSPISIMGIRLYREGNWAKVEVEFPDGRRFEVIREYYDGSFCHHISEHGLANYANAKEVV